MTENETTIERKPPEKMTVPELRKELEERGCILAPKVSKNDLRDLLEGVREKQDSPNEIDGEVLGEEDTALVPPEIEDEIGQAIALREQSVEPVMALPSAQEFNAAMAIANQIAKTTFVPESYRGRPDDVLAAILFGREIGLGPMTAMRDIHMIDGRPALAAHRQLAQLRKGGVVILESEATDERGYIRAQRRDTNEIMAVEFTYEEAEKIRRKGKALVDGDNWRNYRKDMLWARTVGRLTRRLGPDLLNGLPPYVAEEVADFSGWGVEYGAEGDVHVQQWAVDRPAPPSYNFPSSWAELMTRLGVLLGEDEATEWASQAIQALYGESTSDLPTDEKQQAFRRMCAVLAALDTETEGDLQFAPRAQIAAVFARFFDGELVDGPPWSLGPEEADTRPAKGQTTLLEDPHAEEAGSFAPGGERESGPQSEDATRGADPDDDGVPRDSDGNPINF